MPITFQIILIVPFTFSLIISVVGWGRLITNKLDSDFLTNFFFGFITLGCISTFLHFFLKINLFISTIIFFIGILIFLIKNKEKYEVSFFVYLIGILIFLIPIIISQKYHEDFGYYHLPYAMSFFESKIIFGFANVNFAYIYNSIWLNISSLFLLNSNNYDFFTFGSFVLFLVFIFYLFNKVLVSKIYTPSNTLATLVLFYFLLKFTRISEYGLDLPATIFSILGIINFLNYFETENKSKKNFYFFCNLNFSLFAILIKLSALPIVFFSVYLFFKQKYFKNFFVFQSNFLIIYLCFFFYFIQQYIYTGCVIFPTTITCFDVSWFNKDFTVYKKQLELINKNYSSVAHLISPNEYLSNFNWVFNWFKRNFNEIAEHLLTIFLPIIVFYKFHKKKTLHISKFNLFFIFILFSLLNFIFWLNFSPIYRFAIHLFIIFIFLIIVNLLININFSKKIFLIFFIFFLSFNFFKNLNRLKSEEKYFVGIKKIHNNYIQSKINSLTGLKIFFPDIKNNSFNGWQGRLCWDIPFICSYNKVNFDEINSYIILKKWP